VVVAFKKPTGRGYNPLSGCYEDPILVRIVLALYRRTEVFARSLLPAQRDRGYKIPVVTFHDHLDLPDRSKPENVGILNGSIAMKIDPRSAVGPIRTVYVNLPLGTPRGTETPGARRIQAKLSRGRTYTPLAPPKPTTTSTLG
jgi:hypothetical protein